MTVRTVVIADPRRPNPVNSLGAATRSHLMDQIASAVSDPSVTSIVLIGLGSTFSAGADIKEFGVGTDAYAPTLPEVCDALESSPKPAVAAVRGSALGGGCELALSCHYRVADPDSFGMGLPEVKIGLIPGAGGTQRLPRLCGVEFALGAVTSGRTVGLSEALSVGLVDGVLGRGGPPGETLEGCAERWARYAEVSAPLCLDYGRLSQREVPGDPSDLAKLCDGFMAKLPPAERGGESARAAVRAIRASFESPDFSAGMEAEADIFMDLLTKSSQGRALRHAFFAERAAKSRRGPAGAKSGAGPPPSAAALLGDPPKAAVGVIGAGTMGSGIAIAFLRAGYSPVILADNDAKGLERGVKVINKVVQGDVKRKRLSKERAGKILSSLKSTTDLADLGGCALVVEAVFEDLEVKKGVFSKLDVIASPDALLLSNTSTLDVDKVASALSPSRRDKCAGMHFFSPAHVMKLVEIVRASSTSEATLDVVRAVTKQLGKVGVTVGNCDGFVGNRVLFPYTSEMVFVVQEGGATVSRVDEALTEFGMAMGPFVMSDLAGNDIGYNIRREKGLVRDPETGRPGPSRSPEMRYSELPDELITELGRAGQKVGKGWYDYDPKVGKGRKPIPSEEVADLIARHGEKGGRPGKNPLTDDDIVERLLYPLVNEAFKALEEGIASDPGDVDVIYLYGYGFPAWRGGPMHWADNGVGLPRLLGRLEEFWRDYPGSEYFRPSELLRRCVERDVGVQEYYRRGWHREDEPRSKL